jgi:hypothetical protein
LLSLIKERIIVTRNYGNAPALSTYSHIPTPLRAARADALHLALPLRLYIFSPCSIAQYARRAGLTTAQAETAISDLAIAGRVRLDTEQGIVRVTKLDAPAQAA